MTDALSPVGGPPPAARTAAGPVAPSERLFALDAARGFALLGIFVVNIGFFAGPLAEAFLTRPPEAEGMPGAIAWWINSLFFEGRFYPLFSMLFGMGLVLQMNRARAAGRPFVWTYLRRLTVLFLIGVAHVVLLWYGDILIIYSVTGLALLACSRLSARWLLGLAAGALLFGIVLSVGIHALSHEPRPAATAAPSPADQPATPDVPPPAAPATGFSATPVGQLLAAMQRGEVTDPKHPAWVRAEVESYRNGPFSQALIVRAVSWSGMIVFMVLSVCWHVLAMFLLGAALMKLRFFDADRRAWRVRLTGAGFLVGLPVVLGSILIEMNWEQSAMGKAVSMPLLMVGGSLMSLGYLSCITLLVESGRAAGLWRALSNAGRMALSVYLTESLVAAGVMYHWGLGRFATYSLAERMGFVLLVFPLLVLAANVWLRVFRMGPMEWLWRTLTYLRPQPLLR